MTIADKQMYPWRAVAGEGEVLDILVQSDRNKKAALTLTRRLLKKNVLSQMSLSQTNCHLMVLRQRIWTLPGPMISVAGRTTEPRTHTCRSDCGNDECSVSKSVRSVQWFLSIHATVYNSFDVQRHMISRRTLRQFRSHAMGPWQTVTAAA